MKDDKKGLALMMFPKGSKDEPDGDEEGSDEDLQMAASDVLDAIKADDPEALAGALRAAFDICGKY